MEGAEALLRQGLFGKSLTAFSEVIAQSPTMTEAYLGRARCSEGLAREQFGPERSQWISAGLADAKKASTLAEKANELPCYVVLAVLSRMGAGYARDAAYEQVDYDPSAASGQERYEGDVLGGIDTPRHRGASVLARKLETAHNGECEKACRAALSLAPRDDKMRELLQQLRDEPGYQTAAAPSNPIFGGGTPPRWINDNEMRDRGSAVKHKARGNTLFGAKKFAEAEEQYRTALSLDPCDHVLYSNRSACRLALRNFRGAHRDSATCVRLDPTWAKGFSRHAAALYELGRYTEAQKAVDTGLGLDKESAALLELKERCLLETCESAEVQKEMYRLRQEQHSQREMQTLIEDFQGKFKMEVGAKTLGGEAKLIMTDTELREAARRHASLDVKPRPPAAVIRLVGAEGDEEFEEDSLPSSEDEDDHFDLIEMTMDAVDHPSDAPLPLPEPDAKALEALEAAIRAAPPLDATTADTPKHQKAQKRKSHQPPIPKQWAEPPPPPFEQGGIIGGRDNEPSTP